MKLIKKLFKILYNFASAVFYKILNLIKKTFVFIHSKKRLYIPFYSFVLYFLFVISLILFCGDSKFTKTIPSKNINDVTQLNPIQVNKIIQPKTIEEIVNAIKTSTGPISIGGGKYSMGGQTAFNNSLHIDMRKFNKIVQFDKENKQVTVQAGIRWRDLQKVIDKENLSIKIMQTYANFTVGGSISVNCHGRYIGHGAIISSVLSLKLITASGEILIANRSTNQELFYAAIGGYGGIAVIAEATLQLVDNVKVERQTKLLNISEYNDFFKNNIANDTNVVFQNGDLYPPNYDIIHNVSWRKTNKALTDSTRVTPEGLDYKLESNLVEIASWGSFGKWLRRSIFDPYYYSSEKVVWRNKEASYDVAELEPSSREKSTYVLQEYFIPVKNIKSFVPKMKAVFDKYDVNVLNVSLRHAYPDKESYLSWADQEVFAFVVYYKQETNRAAKSIVRKWTIEMTNAILSENGKWYLPYQPHASFDQFIKAYPNAIKYFQIKKQFDSLNRFNNKLLDKYNPYNKQTIEKTRDTINYYFRDEGQSILTVPEWYLVYNPKEYAEFLESGKNPSDFPFLESINEYWTLYDRSQKLVSKAYPENGEYNIMLKVIGVSITMEYAVKIIYENTIGRVFSYFANNSVSEEEKTIIKAQRDYSNFIYDKAWYEFKFIPWIKEVWKCSDTSNALFIRKWERTLFFTIEFTFKAMYAQLLEWAVRAEYSEPITNIYLMINTSDTLNYNSDLKLVKENGNKKIIAITRWGVFTKTILNISNKNIEIFDIGGNDEIVVSLIIPQNKNLNFEKLDLLYESKILTNNKLKRMVCFIKVKDLLTFVNYSKSNSFEVEHIYDY